MLAKRTVLHAPTDARKRAKGKRFVGPRPRADIISLTCDGRTGDSKLTHRAGASALKGLSPASRRTPLIGTCRAAPMSAHPTPFRLACGLLLAGLAASPALAADPIEEVGKTASEWVKTRAETARLTSEWVQDRKLLGSTLDGLKERAARLQDQRDRLLAGSADQRAEHATLAAKLAESRDNLHETEARLQALADQVVRLRPQLPPRLSEALEMAYRSLAGKDAGPGERLQWVFTILNRCAQFNLGVTQGDEILSLPGQPAPKSVEVIYWGLSHGYALDRAAGKAWLGTPGAAGWQWEPLEGAAPAVAELIAIRRDQATPQLVTVPARLKAATP